MRIRVPTMDTCETCHGTGAKAGTTAATCSTCGGHGQVRMQQGFFSIQQTCPNCRGSGKVITNPCGDCNGQGRVKHTKTLSVKVPAGVDEGDQIRLAGEGESGENGGPPGDLYVQIRLKPHDIFKRDGDDLHCEMPISFAMAALGGEVEIPTLGGRANLKIPAGTQANKVFRLRSKGVTNVRNGHVGDLYCHTSVETPVNLTKRQKDLIEELDTLTREGGARHSPNAQSWTDKLKSFFG
jgi:molecular chaperone DnaJ